jgi:hypothetical protein
MPTVLRVEDFVFYFYSNDHEPAHVHAANGDGIAVIEIETGRVVRRVGEISRKDVRRAVEIAQEHRDALLHAWTRHALRRGGIG